MGAILVKGRIVFPFCPAVSQGRALKCEKLIKASPSESSAVIAIKSNNHHRHSNATLVSCWSRLSRLILVPRTERRDATEELGLAGWNLHNWRVTSTCRGELNFSTMIERWRRRWRRWRRWNRTRIDLIFSLNNWNLLLNLNRDHC